MNTDTDWRTEISFAALYVWYKNTNIETNMHTCRFRTDNAETDDFCITVTLHDFTGINRPRSPLWSVIRTAATKRKLIYYLGLQIWFNWYNSIVIYLVIVFYMMSLPIHARLQRRKKRTGTTVNITIWVSKYNRQQECNFYLCIP